MGAARNVAMQGERVDACCLLADPLPGQQWAILFSNLALRLFPAHGVETVAPVPRNQSNPSHSLGELPTEEFT